MNNLDDIMTEDEFWVILDWSLERSSDRESQYEALLEILSYMNDNRLYAFDYRCKKLQNKANFTHLWACAYCAMGDCSEERFGFFKMWLISRGKAVYEAALINADTLYDELLKLEVSEEVCEFEDMDCPALFVYCERNDDKNGEMVTQYLNNFEQVGGYKQDYIEMNTNWDEADLDTMRSHCPRVFDYFRENSLGWT